MTTKRFLVMAMGLIALLFMGCGGSGQEAAGSESEGGSQSEPKNLSEAMDEVQKALDGDGEAKEVVDFRELKKMLPEKVVGMERTSHTGEKAGAMGFNMSTAAAEYRDGERELEVAIVDFAGVGMAMMGLAQWSTVEIDRETDSGYERTITLDGYKAFEKYNRNTKTGELAVLVGDRFIVSANGRNMEEGDFKKAIDQLDIDALAKMK